MATKDDIWLWPTTPPSYHEFCSKMARSEDENYIIDYINHYLPDIKKAIVDFGIGTGRELSWFSKLKNISNIIGIDYSPAMLEYLNSLIKEEKTKILLINDNLLTLKNYRPPKNVPIVYLYLFNSLGDFEFNDRVKILMNVRLKMKIDDVFIVAVSKRPEATDTLNLDDLFYEFKDKKEQRKLATVMEYGVLPFLWNVVIEKYGELPQLWYDDKNNDFILRIRKKIVFKSHRWSLYEVNRLYNKAGLKIQKLIEGKSMFIVISKKQK